MSGKNRKQNGRIVAPKFSPPKFNTTGDDGIPNYIVAQRGQKHHYTPPNGMRLAVFFNGVEVQHVTEADRKNGYVRCAHMLERPVGPPIHLRDGDGDLLYRMYQNGRVTFQLVPIANPFRAARQLERHLPNVFRRSVDRF